MRRLALLAMTIPLSAVAGNIVLTGHDDDLHTFFNSGSNARAQARAIIAFVRAGAPNPSLPVLSFDHGHELTTLLSSLGVPFTNIDPDAGVPSAALFDINLYSAIVVASDLTCGGCDNTSLSSANLNAAAKPIAAFFNLGGGIAAFAGADNTSYYNFVPASASGFGDPPSTGYVQTPFGASLGIPAVNGDPTHNFFFTPGTNGVSAAYNVVETLGVGGQIETIACQGCGAAEIGQFFTFLGTPGTSTNPTGSFAEPVNTAIGNYYTSHTDVALPGKGGMALGFVRFYNSRDTYSGPLGAAWTHSYNIILTDSGTGTITIKEADGHVDGFTSAGGGNYSTTTVGLFDVLKKNADGSFTLTRKNQTQLNFSSGGTLLTIVNRNGNSQSLSYDSSGRLVTVLDASSRSLTLTYDASNRIVTLADQLGRVLHYAYDGSGNLSSFQDALGGMTQYSYDASHRMTAAVDPRGSTYLQNTFDAQGRVITQKNARGFVTTFAYNTPSAGTTTITDPLGNSTKHVYDSGLRLASVVDALGGVVSYIYNANNLKTALIDQLGRVRTFTFDANGNLTSATDANGKTTQFVYDAKNNLLRLIDRLGRMTKFTYDANGNLLTTLDAAGNAASFSYDSAGEVLTVRNPRTFVTSFTYNASGDLTRVTDALGGIVQISYDAVGRLLTVRNQLGKAGSRSYDANNRILSVTDPLGNATHFVYDPDGNLTNVTDANGNTTGYAYDSTNKLTQVTDATGGMTKYAYNGNTDLVSVTDAKGHATNYVYDALRRLKSVTDALGRQKSYGHDGVGNTTYTVDGNGKTNSFSYDTQNRLISMALFDGKAVSYTYDAVGNRMSMTDWRGTSVYTHDVLNRVLSVTTPDGNAVGYTYDEIGKRATLTNANGQTIKYQFDALNRLSMVTDWNGNLTTYLYDAAGNLVSTTLPNRTASTYAYDDADRLLRITNTSKNSTLSGFTYSLDRVGNRLQVTTARGKTTKFGYDSLYRLTSWAAPDGTVTQYRYDAVGNRLVMIGPEGTTNYSYDAADQLLAAGPMAFAYDGNGGQIKKTLAGATVNYGWDAMNRLISITGAGINTQYAYDGDGNRVTQQVTAGTYRYVNDPVASLPVILDESGPDGAIDYVRGLSLISESVATKDNFFQYDGLGSVVTVTNHAGAHQANYAYDPWGQPIKPSDPPIGLDTVGTQNKFRFTGEALDPETNLLYLRARYYEPTLGRFLSVDRMPRIVGAPNAVHAYTYAGNNPAVFTDHDGNLFGIEDAAAAIVGFVGGTVSQYAQDFADNLADPSVHGLSNFIPRSSWEEYATSAVGGAVTDVLSVNCAEIGTAVAGPVGTVVGAGACAGLGTAATDYFRQRVVEHQDVSWSEILVDSGISSLTAGTLETFRIPGREPTTLFTSLFGKHGIQDWLKEAIGIGIDFDHQIISDLAFQVAQGTLSPGVK